MLNGNIVKMMIMPWWPRSSEQAAEESIDGAENNQRGRSRFRIKELTPP